MPVIYGCMDIDYYEYDSLATVDIPFGQKGACSELVQFGCTDTLAFNF